MSERKMPWTPGPWTVGTREDGSHAEHVVPIHAEGWGALAEVVVVVNGEPSPPGEANARLITEAPAMAELLVQCFPILTRLAEQQRQERGGMMEGPASNTGEYFLQQDLRALLARIGAP